MSDSRAAIFAKMRAAIAPTTSGARATPAGTENPSATCPSVSDPFAARPDLTAVDWLERFVLKVEASGATVTRVRNRQEIAGAVVDYLSTQELGKRIVVSADDVLSEVDWPDALRVESRVAQDDDETSVTGVVAAVAETGSIVIESGAQSPNTLAFMPDNHVSVVLKSQLVGDMDDVLRLYSLEGNGRAMPRSLSFVTGPSKTADVEQTLQHGAHGPKRKHVILVDDV